MLDADEVPRRADRLPGVCVHLHGERLIGHVGALQLLASARRDLHDMGQAAPAGEADSAQVQVPAAEGRGGSGSGAGTGGNVECREGLTESGLPCGLACG